MLALSIKSSQPNEEMSVGQESRSNVWASVPAPHIL